MDSLSIQIARCKNWLSSHALPLWAQAQSSETGVFFEGLRKDGSRFSKHKTRFRVQPRQIYVFSHASDLNLLDSKQNVDLAITLGFSHFGSPQRGYRFALSSQNDEHNKQINLYEQAFALLGFAWHYRLIGTKESLKKMEAIYQYIESHLADDEFGGFYLTDDGSNKKGQNPHMHLFEALMVSYEHTDNEIWLKRAERIYELFSTKFMQHNHLAEFFNQDFSLNEKTGKQIDPGHHYEWIWLLNHYQKLTGSNVEHYIQILYRFAQKFGHNENGLVRDEVFADGKPCRSTSRLWCQTEYLKACVALWERNPTKERQFAISHAVEQIFNYYINPAKPGLWVDQLDEYGVVINEHAPASTFYHLFLAFSEVLKLESEG